MDGGMKHRRMRDAELKGGKVRCKIGQIEEWRAIGMEDEEV